jgi:hypothetical protein
VVTNDKLEATALALDITINSPWRHALSWVWNLRDPIQNCKLSWHPLKALER